MGVVDSNKFMVVCDWCGIKENTVVHEKSSAYGASWQDGAELKHSDVVWNDEKFNGPRY